MAKKKSAKTAKKPARAKPKRAASEPRGYWDWRTDHDARAEDAAHTFGYYLLRHCRQEALKDIEGSPQVKAAAERAVDAALHNVNDLLEGFFGPLEAGPDHTVEFALEVRVNDADGILIETQTISPQRLDLPVGYWKWRDGEFR